MKETKWYSYGEITFKRKHIQFILDNAESFKFGRWLPEPKNTGYTDALIGILHIQAEGKQVKPSIVLAEVEQRLEQCGWDGERVLDHYCKNYDIADMAKTAKMFESELEYRMNRAITYAGSGPCRRWASCDNCLQKEVCPKYGKHKPVTYNDWIHHKRRIE